MVEVNTNLFNSKDYTITPAKRDRYKKLGQVCDKQNLQHVQCGSDKAEAVIKFFKIPAQVTASDVKNIYNEARLLLRVPHPNIIRVRDVFKAKGDIGTTFEFIKGGTLGAKLAVTGPLKEADCINYFTQIALAFKEVHDMPAFHKNISTEHILVDETEAGPILKLTGFSKLRSMQHEGSVDSVS